MNWATIKDAISTAVAAATGIPLVNIQWVNTPQAGMWRPFPSVDLVLRAPRRLGHDSHIMGHDVVNDRLTRTIAGPRQFRVEVRVETDNQYGGGESATYVSNLQTRLQRPSVMDILRAAFVNVASVAEGINADIPSDNRMVSLSTLDVVFNAVENDADTTETGDYAETLIFESTPDRLRDPDGTAAENQVVVRVPEE